MTLDGTTNIPEELTAKIEAYCLRDPSVAESLDRCWRKAFVEVHLDPARATRVVVSAIAVRFGTEGGWLTLIRQEGAYKLCFWSPELRQSGSPARRTIDALQAEFGTVLSPDKMEVRGKPPYEWLAHKGWNREEIARIRRAS